MANEWTRLTPEDDVLSGRYSAVHRVCNGDHILAVGRLEGTEVKKRPSSPSFALIESELLALASVTGVWREVAEVQALVKANELVYQEEWPWRIYGILNTAEENELAERFAKFMRVIHAALPPFREPTDAT